MTLQSTTSSEMGKSVAVTNQTDDKIGSENFCPFY